MRIRKHLLSLSHSASSDPQLNHHSPSSLVQPTTTSHELQPIRIQQPNTHSQPSDPSNHPPFHLPSDHPPKIDANTSHKFKINKKVGEQVKLEEASREEEEEEENGAGTRKQNIFLATAPVTESVVLTVPLSSRQVDERWFDGDKEIPVKKRKGQKTSQETLMLEKAKKKSKTNKNCGTTSVQQNDGGQDKAGDDDSNSTNNNINIVKKINKRGGAIMEGSRCSRVNGRGWRCCQQTLVGYSLCEHHLGKGRLRSITNVKGRAKMPSAAAPTTAPHNDSTDNTTNNDQPAKKVLVSSSKVQPARDYYKETTILVDGSCYDDDEDKEEDEDDDDYNDEEMKKPLLVKKKRMKLGMVKARSLSSLLNQTNNAVVDCSSSGCN